MKNTEKEFKTLIKLALKDSALTHDERNVLKERGITMGMEADEIDIILDSYQYKEDLKKAKKSNKCPQCGETLQPGDITCPSCDFVLDSPVETLDDFKAKPIKLSKRQLVEKISKTIESQCADNYKNRDKNSALAWRLMLIIFTGGLYLVYLLIFNRDKLSFNAYSELNGYVLEDIEEKKAQFIELYGNTTDSQKITESIDNRVRLIIRRRWLADFTNALASALVIVAVLFGIVKLSLASIAPKVQKTQETQETALNVAIKDKKTVKARALYEALPAEKRTEKIRTSVLDIEIDSLVQNKLYEKALQKSNLLAFDKKREYEIEDVLKKYIPELIKNKEYNKAKFYAGFASITQSYYFKNEIDKATKTKK